MDVRETHGLGALTRNPLSYTGQGELLSLDWLLLGMFSLTWERLCCALDYVPC